MTFATTPGRCQSATSTLRGYLIEYRPRLQCASIFIHLQDTIGDTVSVSVKPREILLTFPAAQTIKIPLEHFEVHSNTISSMVATGKHISFRINTNSEKFDQEYLTGFSTITPGLVIPINLKENRNFGISCSNCRASLTSQQTFIRRILELPSEAADSSEWFCHKPSTSNTNIFTPKSDEIFYGNFFFTLNRSLLTRVRDKQSLIFCRRCLQLLGQILDDRAKLWNENILFTPENSPELHLMPNTNQTLNFCTIIRKLLVDFTMAGLCGLAHFHKIIFSAHLPDGKIYYLLVQIVDKNLDVFHPNGTNVAKGRAIKVMYQRGDAEDVPHLKDWMGDENVTQVEISCKMLQDVLNAFIENSQVLPQIYRTSCGFQLSYLFYN
uniref:E3 ubiquitin-protein ligase E3D n=1 Tax=Nyssomyia neivai TaxID=330878 RepID=A0A1L8DSK3_9DIPT